MLYCHLARASCSDLWKALVSFGHWNYADSQVSLCPAGMEPDGGGGLKPRGGLSMLRQAMCLGKGAAPGCRSSGSTQSQPWVSFLRTPSKMLFSSRVAVLMYKVWKRESSFSPRPATFCSPVGSMTCCQTVNDVLVLSLLLFWSCEACAVNTRC